MTFSSSDIKEVARSREKTDHDVIDLATIEAGELLESQNSSSLPDEPSTFRKASHWKKRTSFAIIVLVILIVVPPYIEKIFSADIANGISISGVNVGSMSVNDAQAKLVKSAATAIDTPLVFTLGKDSISVSSQDLALAYDIPASIKLAQDYDSSLWPTQVIPGFFDRHFGSHNIAPVVTYSAKKLDGVTRSMVNELSMGRTDAGVTIEGTKVSVIAPHSGKGVPARDAREALLAAMSSFSRSKTQLSARTVDAQITLKEANKTATILRKMFAEDSVLTTPGGNSVTIAPSQLSSAISVTPNDSKLNIGINGDTMRSTLADQLTATEVPAKDASFAVLGNTVSVLPSVSGKQIDFSSALTHWIVGEHKFTVAVSDLEPTHNTAWAQKLNITEPVSTFTTNFPAGQIRIKNITRAATVVNNTVIEPGQIFSLNQKLGKRTAESGYFKAPVYSSEDGFFEDYGGGASQFSTTMFNAAFIGGYKDITHSPHSIYISRYPMGREATLNWGTIDMSFQDDSNSGILVKTSVGPTSVTVTFYGNKEGRTVKLEGPAVLSEIPITTKYTDDPNLDAGKEKEIAHGYPGIVVENFRTISRPGQADKRERYRWTYTMVERTAYRGTKAVPPPPA